MLHFARSAPLEETLRYALALLFTALVSTVPVYGLAATSSETLKSEPAAKPTIENLSKTESAPAKESVTKPEAQVKSTPEPSAQATAEPSVSPTPETTPEATVEPTKEVAQVKHKSPALAGGLAFIPGIVVHGTGHFYAGHWMKGLGLLTIEAASIAVIYGQANDAIKAVDAMNANSKNGQISMDVSQAYSTLGIVMVGTMAFLYSWFDDMAGAPIAAKEYNRKADEAASQAGSQSRMIVAPVPNGGLVAFTRSF